MKLYPRSVKILIPKHVLYLTNISKAKQALNVKPVPFLDCWEGSDQW